MERWAGIPYNHSYWHCPSCGREEHEEDDESVHLPRVCWIRILNLLTEELDVWEKESPDYNQIDAMISAIEAETGIRKKANP